MPPLRYVSITFLSLLAAGGCRQESNPVGPISTSSASSVKDGVLYTFAVPQNALGVFDTLSMSLTALNQTSSPETLSTGLSPAFYTWSLTDPNGATIIAGPWLANALIRRVALNPHQSAVLYSLSNTMADIFNAPIEAGTYVLHWNLSNGLSFQLPLACGKSKGEITDATGLHSPIFPLKVGNRWSFEQQIVFVDGSVADNGVVTQTIVGEEIIDGEKWFLLRAPMLGDELVTSRNDGIYEYFSAFKTALLKYKYPAVPGEQYVSGVEEWTGTTDTVVGIPTTVDSTLEVVTVPCGQYQCLKYSAPEVLTTFGNMTNEIGPVTAYVSRLGPVRWVFYAGNGKPVDIYELISTNVQ
jgi:hypothetical protein